MITKTLLKGIRTKADRELYQISTERKVLLVFLRHFGCVFCREAMKDLSKVRSDFEKNNVELIFVHMSTSDVAESYFNKYNLSGVDSISDPDCRLYQQFGLVKGKPSQLFGLKNWVRGFEVTLKDPSIISLRQIGDGFQMPGVFVLNNGEVEQSFIHKSAADRPDYNKLVNVCEN